MKKICKNIILAFGAVALMVTPLIASMSTKAASVTSQVNLADGGGGSGGGSTTTVQRDQGGNFLGMKPWYEGLVYTNGELMCVNDDGSGDCKKLSDFIWTTVANVASDIAIISAYLALGFVIYGGYQYMFSSGDAGKAASGKKIITNASIGLVIVIMANVIFNTVRVVLSGGASATTTVNGMTLVVADPTTEVIGIINWVLGIAGVVALAFVVLGAVSYMTAAGDAGKLTKAKNTILYALIGLLIVGLAEAIVAFVAGNARGAIKTENTPTAIVKELNEKTLG